MKNWLIKNISAVLFTVFALLVSVSSIVDTQNSGQWVSDESLFNVERASILIETYSAEPRPRGSEFHETVRQGLISDIQATGFTPIQMDYRLTTEDAQTWGTYYGDDLIADSLVRNLLVHIPGTGAGDAILFMGHYDSVPMGPGANDNLIAVATMIEMMHAISDQGLTFENDLIFLIPDGEEEGLYGARLFASKRMTVNPVDYDYIDLADHVKFLVNHESRGTGGTAIMFETTQDNAQTIALFAQMNRDIYTNSIANFIYSMMPNGTDYSAFSELGIQGINVANIGEGYNYHTQYDRFEEFDLALLAQHIQLDHQVLAVLGDYDLSQLYEADENAVFFSYLNIAVFHYSHSVAWALLIALIGLMGYALFRLGKKALAVLKGLSIVLITMISTIISLMVVRPLLEMIPVFGVRLNASSYADTLLMFAIYSLATVIIVLIMQQLMKWMKVKAEQVVQGNILLFTLLGAAITVALFEISFLFVIPALLGALMMVGFSHYPINHQKWVYSTITFFFLPLSYPLLSLASEALGASMYDYISAIYVLLVSFSLPFVVELISERQKGIQRYSLSLAFLALSVVFTITEVVAPLGISLSTNLSGKASGRSVLFTDDTLFIEQDNGRDEAELVIKDFDAIEFMKTSVIRDGFVYNEASSSYRMPTTPIDYFVGYSTSWTSSTTVVLSFQSIEDGQYLEIDLPIGVIDSLSIVENGWTTTHTLTSTQFATVKIFNDATITFNLTSPSVVDLVTRFYDLSYEGVEAFGDAEEVMANYLTEGLHTRVLIHDELVLIHP